MGYPKLLLYSLLAVLGGLPLGALVAAFGFVLWSWAAGDPPPDAGAALAGALMMAMFACIFGALPALLFGAPMYALLWRFGLVGVLSAGMLGAIPGGLLLLVERSSGVGWLFVMFGVPVALATHALARAFSRSARAAAAMT